jgi:putative mRNA 3-end processing factor
MEYVAATRASYVVVDNSRHGNAIELADAIRTDLGIAAVASEVVADFRWGI